MALKFFLNLEQPLPLPSVLLMPLTCFRNWTSFSIGCPTFYISFIFLFWSPLTYWFVPCFSCKLKMSSKVLIRLFGKNISQWYFLLYSIYGCTFYFSHTIQSGCATFSDAVWSLHCKLPCQSFSIRFCINSISGPIIQLEVENSDFFLPLKFNYSF